MKGKKTFSLLRKTLQPICEDFLLFDPVTLCLWTSVLICVYTHMHICACVFEGKLEIIFTYKRAKHPEQLWPEVHSLGTKGNSGFPVCYLHTGSSC